MYVLFLLVASMFFMSPAHAADMDVRWGSAGQVESLRSGDALLATGGELLVAGHGWKVVASQTRAKDTRRTETPEGPTWTGRLEAQGIDARFSQRLRKEGERVRLDITLEAQQPIEGGTVVWCASVPLSAIQDSRWVVASQDALEAGIVPAQTANPYVMCANAGARWFGWVGERAGLRITGAESSVGRVQVQDNRHFNHPYVQFQVQVPITGTLAPGKPIRLSLALDAIGPEAIAAEEARIRAGQGPLKGQGPLAIHKVTADRAVAPQFEKVELRLDLSATYDNPFDPDQVDVSARFRTPSGKSLVVPGFLYRPHTRTREGKTEQVSPTGPADWRVRFAPTEVGEYTYTVSVRDRTGSVTSPTGRFRAVQGKRPGYVRVGKQDRRYFAFDNGAPYFALGANVCWPQQGGTYDYDEWFARYADAGCNYARLWIGPFDVFTLERKALLGREDTGLGRYDLANAWRLDHVLETAERHDIYLMYCIESFNSLRAKPKHSRWNENPYSTANGGIISTPHQFFTNAEAQRLFRNRLRYLVARWGYSSHVMCWEFWNEVDIIDDYKPIRAEVKRWHAEMSHYLRAIDPWKHLHSTSFATNAGDPDLDAIPEMDFVQTHSYGQRDMTQGLTAFSRKKQEDFKKPHFVGEFGLDGGGNGADRDPDGLSLHNGLWATTMSGDAGTAMLWWWDSYIHPRDLYGHFAALSGFLKGVDWPRAGFHQARPSVVFAKRPTQPVRGSRSLDGVSGSWSPSPANQPNTFTIPRSGPVEGVSALSNVQHGVGNHPRLHNPVTFLVDYPVTGQFSVQVTGVSGHGGAALKISLDGKSVLEKDFPDPDGLTKTDTLTNFNGAYTVEVPAGKHTLVVENTGKDWFTAGYTFHNYLEQWDPPLRALALVGQREVLAWVQHLDSTWSRRASGVQAAPVAGALLQLSDVRPGRYRVVLWDTYRGVALKEQTLAATGGTLAVPLPEIARDVAVRATLLP